LGAIIGGAVGGLALLILIILIVALTRRKKMPVLIDLAEEAKVLFLSAHLSHDQNKAHRRSMEDEHVLLCPFAGTQNLGYFAVYDGHGGRKVVESVKRHLHQNIEAKITASGGDPVAARFPEIIKDAFTLTDAQVKRDVTIGIKSVASLSKVDTSGSCAVIGILGLQKGERFLHVANVGDSRAILNRKGKAMRLSYDHKASDEGEKKRIESLGGMVLHNKVAGLIAVSRAFGDFELKSKEANFITVEPFITSVPLEKGDSHLILACDGLFDVTTDQEALDLISPCLDASEASEKLVKHAILKGSKDNISVIVVFL